MRRYTSEVNVSQAYHQLNASLLGFTQYDASSTASVDATDEYLNHQQNVSKLAELRLIAHDYGHHSNNDGAEERPLDLVMYSQKKNSYTEEAQTFQYKPESDGDTTSSGGGRPAAHQITPKRSLTSCVDSILSLKFKQNSGGEQDFPNEKVTRSGDFS